MSFTETLYALAAFATIGGFLLEAVCKIYRFAKGRSARKRMEREGVGTETPENE